MNDRRSPVKAVLLIAPLLVLVLTLHAWGDAMAGGLNRAVGIWLYPERSHSQFLIRVARRTTAEVFAAPALEEFVQKAVKAHGVALSIQVPAQPVTVILLDPDTDPRRFGWGDDELLAPNVGLFDPARRMILVRMERTIHQDQVVLALQQAAARLLLHDAGSARWSPWLTEGLAGRLDGSRLNDFRNWAVDLPSVSEILTSRESEYRSHNAAAYTRGARLLAAFLMETKPEEFAYYYRKERAGLPSPLPEFGDRFGDPAHVDSDWKLWLRAQK